MPVLKMQFSSFSMIFVLISFQKPNCTSGLLRKPVWKIFYKLSLDFVLISFQKPNCTSGLLRKPAWKIFHLSWKESAATGLVGVRRPS